MVALASIQRTAAATHHRLMTTIGDGAMVGGEASGLLGLGL